MRKLIRIAMVMVLALCVAAAAAEPMDGGWEIASQEAAALPADAQAAFDKAMESLVGAEYTPVALLGTQLVAGTNYCILCRIAPVVPNPVPHWALVYIYADLQGGAEITNVADVDIPGLWNAEDSASLSRTVAPNPVDFDLLDVEDGVYPASFDADAVEELEDGITWMTFHVFSEDTYDIAEIGLLEQGDVIVIDGRSYPVEDIERSDGMVLINGGLEEGGFTLAAEDESNCFIVWGYDDMTAYTDLGIAMLPVSEDVVYDDSADPENPETTGFADLAQAIEAGADWGFDQYNTRVSVESGRITAIERFYTP